MRLTLLLLLSIACSEHASDTGRNTAGGLEVSKDGRWVMVGQSGDSIFYRLDLRSIVVVDQYRQTQVHFVTTRPLRLGLTTYDAGVRGYDIWCAKNLMRLRQFDLYLKGRMVHSFDILSANPPLVAANEGMGKPISETACAAVLNPDSSKTAAPGFKRP